MSTFSVTTATGFQNLCLHLLFSGACSQLGFPRSSLFSRSILLLALLFCSQFGDFMAARLPATFLWPHSGPSVILLCSLHVPETWRQGQPVLLYEEILPTHQCFWMKGTIPKGSDGTITCTTV